MSDALQKAIELFCQLIPESKIGTYSANPNDDRRLKAIYETAINNHEDIHASDIIECLKECHPGIAEVDIIKCGDSAFRHMLDFE